MKQGPRCASEMTQNDKVCPRCKLPVSKMKFDESLYDSEGDNVQEPIKTKQQLKFMLTLKKIFWKKLSCLNILVK